jgi:hypothetical protein
MPMEVTLTDFYVIAGPNMSQRTEDDEFVPVSEDLIAPYDENNAYHIFTNNLTVKR